ncbi:MAG: class I SAM-dependent methyltransferase [Lacunisphaera sp.]
MISTTATIKRRFDALASSYDRWDAEHRSVTKRRLSLLRPLRGKILEIAVGTGLNLPCYRKGADVTACDISGGMLNHAATRLAGLDQNQIKLMKTDAHKLFFLDGTFDVVVGTFLFCSVDNPGKVAREIRRVLKPSGRFVTLGYRTEKVLQLLGRAGLKIVSSKEWASEGRPIGQIVATRAT